MTALAAFAIPVRLPEGGTRKSPGEILPEALVEAEPENLGAFLEIRRWSAPSPAAPAVSPPTPSRTPAETENRASRSVNPILVEMGYVGLITSRGQHAVLLALPDGKVVRMVPGDTLPDGRILVSVTDNSLTLKVENQPEEVLTLFPRANTGFRIPDGSGRASGERFGEGAARPVPNKAKASR